MTDGDVKRFISKRRYVQVELSNNPKLTDLTLEYLGGMDTLKELKINSANNFTAQGVENFKRMKPTCSVHFANYSIIKKKKFSQLFESVISNGIGTSK